MENLIFTAGILVAAIVSYLFGSVNFAIIVTSKFMKGEDIRNHGSGNAGMTNVLRTVGKIPALLTLLGDLLKSVIAAIFSYFIFVLLGYEQWGVIGMLIGSASAFTGHLYPIYYKFKGGKGVLSTAGVFLIIDWRITVTCVIIFILMLAITKIVSISSLVGVGMIVPTVVAYLLIDGVPVDAGFIGKIIVGLYITVIVTIKHKENIKRLKAGIEPKIGQKIAK